MGSFEYSKFMYPQVAEYGDSIDLYACTSIIMLNDAKLLLLFYLIYRPTSNMRWKWIETYPRKSSQRMTVI